MGTVIIRQLDLPYSVKGFVSEDADGDYNVFINARYDSCVQQETVKHEMTHIVNADISSVMPLSNIEEWAGLVVDA